MKKSLFSEEQIIGMLREGEGETPVLRMIKQKENEQLRLVRKGRLTKSKSADRL